MKYTIDIDFQKSEGIDNITLLLDTTNEGCVKLTSYSTEMNLSQFIEFSDAINELRQKVEALMSKEENNGRTN